ncbi:ComEC/Rec2 family competence protein [Arthrobacter sp. AL12]|uniref:ComEC/Rec2 family competence protein n=1 Tax=Arthrobacter sp. AL12 TaxID=3042241 RepID=UPI00249C2D21|nr:ComEC/Rec2 family competence protein [Arthrobacter sp. AL12]MDI3211272.1 ComEC/Rec2 family competence protein [Arthrobacter sp. AL12]
MGRTPGNPRASEPAHTGEWNTHAPRPAPALARYGNTHVAAARLQARPQRRGGPAARGWLTSFAVRGRAGPARADTLRRTDVRLVPPAVLVWATAAAVHHLHPAALAALCLSLVAGSGLLLLRAVSTAGARPPGAPAHGSFHATMAGALLLAAAAGGHGAADSARRHEGAVAAAAASNTAVAVEIEIAGSPRRLRTPGRSGLADRWAVPATLINMTFDSHRVQAPARLLVLGGGDWERSAPGQRIRTTGKLKPPGPGQPEAAVLSVSSAPLTLGAASNWQQGPAELRGRFTTAAGRFDGDAQGLLPGMVTGDTSRLDPELDAAMKSVGMTHLTAVSGANCSLILGALLLAARSLRFNRAFAAVLCLAGLGLFVLMVGPESSVLRAAVMGAIGLVALAGGRPGRGLSFLCLAVIGLVLVEPGLSTSFGFLLSVLATLGIVVTARPIMAWFPAPVPRWLAAGFAVPLSAQAFCGPAIVFLQPQFSTYALPANMAAAVLVAPVTLLGTAAVPLVPLAPALAAAPLGIAAAFATGVGVIARCFAGLPGAVLPWTEGVFGAATMTLFSACTIAAWWLLFHPARTAALARDAHERIVALLNRIPPRGDGLRASRGGARPGLVHRLGRGRLRVCKQYSGRKPQWLLPRPHAHGPPRRTPPPGAT